MTICRQLALQTAQVNRARPGWLPFFRIAALSATLLGIIPGETMAIETSMSEPDGPVLYESETNDELHDPFDENTEPIDDPWEASNTTIFGFNQSADRYLLEPLASGYDWIMPDPLERAIGRAIHNVRFVPRMVNSALQGKGHAAGVELGRFVINSSIGLAGLFDVAYEWFGLDSPAGEDAGQTLAVYGIRSGPYLVLPLLPPTTVRDGAGTLVDLVLDPLTLLAPLAPQLATRAGETVNSRSQNLHLYEGVEQGTLDLYAAVRDAYAQTRQKAVRE